MKSTPEAETCVMNVAMVITGGLGVVPTTLRAPLQLMAWPYTYIIKYLCPRVNSKAKSTCKTIKNVPKIIENVKKRPKTAKRRKNPKTAKKSTFFLRNLQPQRRRRHGRKISKSQIG